jgi:predicted kinase
MRKWMRERLKRRKKEPETAKAETAPAPLQPAFYDTQPAPETTKVEEARVETASPPPEPTTPVESESAQSQHRDAPKRRRRRSRGRGGRGAPAPQPATIAGPVPAVSTTAEPALSSGVAAPAADAPPASPRPSRGTVILAIGLPGSGKSSWFKRHNITPLSSDLLRSLLFDDPTEQRYQDLVFSNLRSMLKARLIARRPMNYVDATNLTSHDRHGWIKLAKDYGYDVQAVFFDVPLEVCLERNQRRERVVGEDVMRRMAAKLKAPTFAEGFSKITMVRVKQKD